jgi:type IV secretory pathway TrbF-like protein
VPEKAIPQTPYVRARQEWDERFGDQIKSKNNWRLAAFISMGTTFFCVTGMVAIGYRSNTVPYVVALDDVGGRFRSSRPNRSRSRMCVCRKRWLPDGSRPADGRHGRGGPTAPGR